METYQKEVGDVECYTNGEFGISHPQKLDSQDVTFGPAGIQFETNDLDIDDQTMVCHIGGY